MRSSPTTPPVTDPIGDAASADSGRRVPRQSGRLDLAPGRRAGWADRRRGLVIGSAVAVVVALLAQVPLLSNRLFYFWDDSAVEFMPDWYKLGEQLLAGHWPTLLPDMWAGGNFAAEALVGIWNPVVLTDSMLTVWLGDLAVAAVVIKTQFLVILAVGTYLLCREYGARRGPAAALAIALPFAGFTLYFDASSWIAGLMGFAWSTHYWWSARKAARSAANPLLPFVFGTLAVTTGNPYGVLGVVVVTGALAVELLSVRAFRATGRLLAVSAVIGLELAALFLPLVLSTRVTQRDTAAGIANTGFLVPGLADVLNFSSPSHLAHTYAFRFDHMSMPATYLSWFIVPLLPWLRSGALPGALRSRLGIVVFGGVYLLMVVGPSQIWLFRWPLRQVEYWQLAVCVLFAVLLSQGIAVDRPRRRAAWTAAIAGPGLYLSWAARPDLKAAHLEALLLVGGLFIVLMVCMLRRPRLVPVVLASGTAAVLVWQTSTYPGNFNVTPWYAPHDVAAIRAEFGTEYQGNTILVGDPGHIGDQRAAKHAWAHYLPGNIMQVAGVRSLNGYTGIFHKSFMSATCMNYYGGTCDHLVRNLWRPEPTSGALPADLLRLETIAVNQSALAKPKAGAVAAPTDLPPAPMPPMPPPGWRIASSDKTALVLRRLDPLPWPKGRVSWSRKGVDLIDDHTAPDGVGEVLRYTGAGEVRLAALVWPGWHAEVDGRKLTVGSSYAGLIDLDLPAAAPGGSTVEIEFRPPGYKIAVPVFWAGIAMGLSLALATALRSRARRNRPNET